MKIQLAHHTIDLDSGEISSSEHDPLIRLGAAETRLLARLLEADGEHVSRQDLLQIGWPGKVVGPNSLNVAIANLRRNLPSPLRLITLPRLGYRIIGLPKEVIPNPIHHPHHLQVHCLLNRIRQQETHQLGDHLTALATLHEVLSLLNDGRPGDEEYLCYTATIAELFNSQPDLNILARGISRLTLRAIEQRIGNGCDGAHIPH